MSKLKHTHEPCEACLHNDARIAELEAEVLRITGHAAEYFKRIYTLEDLLRRWQSTLHDTGVPVRLIEDTDAAFPPETLGAWRHCRPIEPHRAEPDMSRTYRQGGTGGLEAPCLACDGKEAVVFLPTETPG